MLSNSNRIVRGVLTMKKIAVLITLITIVLMLTTSVSALQYYYDIPSASEYPTPEAYDIYSYGAELGGETIIPEEYISKTYDASLAYGQPLRTRTLARYSSDYRGIDHIPTYWTRFSQIIGPLRYGNLPVTERFRLSQETEEYPYYEYRKNFAQYGSDYYPPYFQTSSRLAERESQPDARKILEPRGGHFPLLTGRNVYAAEMNCIETGRAHRVFTGTPMSFTVRDVIEPAGNTNVVNAVCPSASAVRKEIACIVAPNTFVRLACGRDTSGKQDITIEPMQATELSSWTRTKLMQGFHAEELYP